MLDHLSLQCSDMSASAAFYDAVLAPLGGRRIMDFGSAIGYGAPPSPEFWIGQQTTGEGFRESHVAFLAPDRAAVRAFFGAAVESGAEILHEPRLWPEYHPDYYGAFVRDPDKRVRAINLVTSLLRGSHRGRARIGDPLADLSLGALIALLDTTVRVAKQP